MQYGPTIHRGSGVPVADGGFYSAEETDTRKEAITRAPQQRFPFLITQNEASTTMPAGDMRGGWLPDQEQGRYPCQ